MKIFNFGEYMKIYTTKGTDVQRNADPGDWVVIVLGYRLHSLDFFNQ
jgi:hypothetical protein